MIPLTLLEYIEPTGRSPYAKWFDGLNAPAAAKVTVALTRLSHGNVSSVKSVGAGVLELRIDFGPGYRIYFAKEKDQIVILFGGGTKKRQQHDISQAVERWQDYKNRKRQG